MASSSIFIYELRSPAEINVESIYSRLKGYPEDENTYFNLEMISANELLGEYVIVQNAQEKNEVTAPRHSRFVVFGHSLARPLTTPVHLFARGFVTFFTFL